MAKKKGSEPYETSGMDNRAFARLFKEIYQSKRKKRRNAKRTMTPTMLKKQMDLLALGTKEDGSAFTRDDLKEFEKVRRKHRKDFDSLERGIPFSMMATKSRDIDIKRANNQVSDGRGITNATPVRLKHDTLTFRVKASAISEYQEHVVEIRMEEWEDRLQDTTGTKTGLRKSAKSAAAGRLSVGCDCGRWQYWYRYVATQGKYCLSPVEYSFPKVRNPGLEGTACKHVLKASQKLQSPTIHNWLAQRMDAQISKRGFGDDARKTSQFVDPVSEKELSKARSDMIHLDKVTREYEQYQKAKERIKGLSKDQAKVAVELKKVRRKAQRLEQDNERLARELAKFKRKEAAQKKKALDKSNEKLNKSDVKRLMGKKDKVLQSKWKEMKKFAELMGQDEKAALRAFAKQNGLTVAKLKDLI